MLRSFRLVNHRSIRDEQELLLIPAYDKQQLVVPVAAIFGANASGKSNLLGGLDFMRTAVRTSYSAWEPGAGVPRQPFRLDLDAGGRASEYAVDLHIDGTRFAYGFAVDDERVREEWLHAYPQARRRVIFERDGDAIQLGSTLPEHRSREAMLTGLTRDNALLLSTAAHANQQEVMPVYGWFRNGVNVLRNQSSRPDLHGLGKRLAPDARDRKATVDLIRAADLGISDIQVEQPDDAFPSEFTNTIKKLRNIQESSPDAAERVRSVQLARDLERRSQGGLGSRLLFVQGRNGIALALSDQSEGTRAWIALLARALTTLDQGSVLAIDELDTSLHPRLTARLIELFQDERTNPLGAQLVFATHDASLLGTSFGRDVLARDQIWFTQKDDDGATTLFPLTDFHPRKEESTERRYLGGSYGAVPAVFSDSLVETYLQARQERSDDPA